MNKPIARNQLKFRPSVDGHTAAIPNTGEKVTDHHAGRAKFAWYTPERRFVRFDAQGRTISTGAKLRDVMPELAAE